MWLLFMPLLRIITGLTRLSSLTHFSQVLLPYFFSHWCNLNVTQITRIFKIITGITSLSWFKCYENSYSTYKHIGTYFSDIFRIHSDIEIVHDLRTTKGQKDMRLQIQMLPQWIEVNNRSSFWYWYWYLFRHNYVIFLRHF